jgi:hypothetical protein
LTYNGWTNYETWAVSLWLNNEEGTHLRLREMAREAWDNAKADGTSTREEVAVISLAEAIKNWIEEMNPLAEQASLFSDLLSAAISEVDWSEIATAELDDVKN